jgi:ubiquinone/menaquinone biosynthesis C-methylase UbiE
MLTENRHFFLRCPEDGSKLRSTDPDFPSDTLTLICDGESHVFPIEDGVVRFVEQQSLGADLRATLSEYDRIVDYYDAAISWLFESFYEDEGSVRQSMVDLLRLESDSRVLEVGAGTGRDSLVICDAIGPEGLFVGQDLSSSMLDRLKRKVQQTFPSIDCAFFTGEAANLPIENRVFDAVYSFGGLNEFGDIRKALGEMSRVTKIGGRVVVGDEGIAPWLSDSEYARIIQSNNPIFERGKLPLDSLPQEAREVEVRWVIGASFYLIAFTVGDGLPKLNLDLEHAGFRGGSLRSRHWGRLEGIDTKLKEEFQARAKSTGSSERQVLEELLKTWLRQNEGKHC